MDETLLLIGDGDDTEANTKCQYYYSDCQSANSGESIERGICEVDFDRKADTFAIGQIEAGNLILLWQKMCLDQTVHTEKQTSRSLLYVYLWHFMSVTVERCLKMWYLVTA